jgi:hypothetical protein
MGKGGSIWRPSKILESSLGNKPSFAWRSIFSAKDLVQQGLIWRVGDGNSIHVWDDRWIPRPTSFLVQSPPNQIAGNSLVSNLIDRDLRSWNVGLIHSIFTEDEAQLIINIPLCPTFPPDHLVWQGTSNGVFSVHSAYHLAKELQQRNCGECSNPVTQGEVWRVLWSLQIPNPVKVFLWKACHNLLPTKANLFTRKVVDNNCCPVCLIEEENIFHALWGCSGAKDVWGFGPKCFHEFSMVGDSFVALFEFLFHRLNLEQMALMAMVARKI